MNIMKSENVIYSLSETIYVHYYILYNTFNFFGNNLLLNNLNYIFGTNFATISFIMTGFSWKVF